MRKKYIDFAVVILCPLFVFLSVFLLGLKPNYLESLLLFFGIPSLYLSIRSWSKTKKVGLFSFLISAPIALIFILLIFGDNAWFVPKSVLQNRLLGLVTLEDFVWMFLCTYVILIFYEHFFDKQFDKKTSSRVRNLLYALYGITFIFVTLFLITGSLLVIPYSYFLLCVLFWIIPISAFLIKYPEYIKNFAKVALFFFYLHLLFELMGLQMGYWVFSGAHYIGWISIFGFNIPLEEFLFVILFGGLAPCVYYEYFTDRKLDIKHSSMLK